jgi:hypothetical protein
MRDRLIPHSEYKCTQEILYSEYDILPSQSPFKISGTVGIGESTGMAGGL